MRVGLDIDNVILDIMTSAKLVKANDIGIDPEEIIETGIYFDPFSHENPDVREKLKLTHCFWDREEVLLGSPPLKGAINAVKQLHNAGLLSCYITRRPPQVERLTRASLAMHEAPEAPVVHVGNIEKSQYYAKCKSTVCIKYGITHMVDDQPTEVDALTNAGIKAIIVDAPIGREARGKYLTTRPNIPVARDLGHAASMILEELNIAA